MPGLRKLIHMVLPVHTYAPLRAEMHMAWVRLQSRGAQRAFRGRKNLLLNIGAGDQGRQGWINVDAASRRGVNCVYDCRRGLPFEDDSVRGIFCEHFFEHLDYFEEAPDFLHECHRVLQPGGVLRVIVPDLEKYIHAYCHPGWETMSRIRPLNPEHIDAYTGAQYSTKMELLNHLFRQGFEHKYAYDFETLALLLRKSGIAQVCRSEFGQSASPDLCLDQESRASESLYVEGQKAGAGKCCS